MLNDREEDKNDDDNVEHEEIIVGFRRVKLAKSLLQMCKSLLTFLDIPRENQSRYTQVLERMQVRRF
jgi:hypothetical protein